MKAEVKQPSGMPKPEAKGPVNRPYEDWTREALLQKAREVGLNVSGGVSKNALVALLRK